MKQYAVALFREIMVVVLWNLRKNCLINIICKRFTTTRVKGSS